MGVKASKKSDKVRAEKALAIQMESEKAGLESYKARLCERISFSAPAVWGALVALDGARKAAVEAVEAAKKAEADRVLAAQAAEDADLQKEVDLLPLLFEAAKFNLSGLTGLNLVAQAGEMRLWIKGGAGYLSKGDRFCKIRTTSRMTRDAFVGAFCAWKGVKTLAQKEAAHAENVKKFGRGCVVIGEFHLTREQVAGLKAWCDRQPSSLSGPFRAADGLRNYDYSTGELRGKYAEQCATLIPQMWAKMEAEYQATKAARSALDAEYNALTKTHPLIAACYGSYGIPNREEMVAAAKWWDYRVAELQEMERNNFAGLAQWAKTTSHYSWQQSVHKFTIRAAKDIKAIDGKSVCEHLAAQPDWVSAQKADAIAHNQKVVADGNEFVSLKDIEKFDGVWFGMIDVQASTMLPASSRQVEVAADPWFGTSASEADDDYYEVVTKYAVIDGADPRWDLIGK